MSWITYALLSAIFAAFTAILAKIGIKNVDSNLATAIRTIVIVLFAWGIVFYQGTYKQLNSISKYSLVFLILSGIATGLSWLFYFRALQQSVPGRSVCDHDNSRRHRPRKSHRSIVLEAYHGHRGHPRRVGK